MEEVMIWPIEGEDYNNLLNPINSYLEKVGDGSAWSKRLIVTGNKNQKTRRTLGKG
ncbi:unnamed protein product, partial [Rotaria sp. Silwood1]